MRLARHSLSSLSRGQEGAVSVISQQRQQQGSEGGHGRAWCGGAGHYLALVGIKLHAEEEKKNTRVKKSALGFPEHDSVYIGVPPKKCGNAFV